MTVTTTQNFLIVKNDDETLGISRKASQTMLELRNNAEAAELAAALAKIAAVRTTKDNDAFNRAFAGAAL